MLNNAQNWNSWLIFNATKIYINMFENFWHFTLFSLFQMDALITTVIDYVLLFYV